MLIDQIKQRMFQAMKQNQTLEKEVLRENEERVLAQQGDDTQRRIEVVLQAQALDRLTQTRGITVTIKHQHAKSRRGTRLQMRGCQTMLGVGGHAFTQPGLQRALAGSGSPRIGKTLSNFDEVIQSRPEVFLML